LRLERVNPWERIASRRRPAFSSHLRNVSQALSALAAVAITALGSVSID
jgi:hypothetical protein